MENHPQFRKSLSRNNMGRLMGIIKQELRTFKGTEDVVMRVVDMIKRDFSKNKELTFNKNFLSLLWVWF